MSELDILFKLLPLHLSNESFPLSQLLDEGNRARKLGFEMLDVLSAAELNRPFSATKMQQVEELFQVEPHPNPEMKVIQRIDWLAKADYKLSVARVGQLEVRRDIFLMRAIAFLGRQIVLNMIGIADRFAKQVYSSSAQNEKMRSLFEAIGWVKEILSVSCCSRFFSLFF